MYSRLLIPLDGSRLSEGILPYARCIARALNAEVELLQVIHPDAISAMTDPQVGRYVDAVEAGMVRNSSDYLDAIAKSLTGLTVSRSVEKGNPAEIIADRAASGSDTLIAMSTHGRSGVERWVLGSVADKVLHACTNPLLLVRVREGEKTDEQATLTTIHAPLDGSALAELVLPHVTALAQKMDLEVVLLRSPTLPAYAMGEAEYGSGFERLTEVITQESERYLEEKVQELRGRGLKKVSSVLLKGPAAAEIIDTARQTPDNLLAMCTHGRSGVGRWVLGSVTERVVRHCGDPVLVIRAPVPGGRS